MSTNLLQAIETLNRGGIIAYPTEAVYGLGCRADDRAAVERICTLKQRPVEQGVIVLVDHIDQLGDWIAPLDADQQASLQLTWPGPVTWLIPTTEHCPVWLTGKHSSLAVRQSSHPLCRQLCAELNVPLVSTSANRSGEEPARSALEAQQIFGDSIDLVLDAPLGDSDTPSAIFDLQTGEQIR
jgi:L-threonylcarbamoyladenylate synthase